MAVAGIGGPARGLEALELVGARSESEVAPSMVMLLSSHSTIRLESLRWPASADGLMADAFHQIAVADAMT